jgi:hypothetical protein
VLIDPLTFKTNFMTAKPKYRLATREDRSKFPKVSLEEALTQVQHSVPLSPLGLRELAKCKAKREKAENTKKLKKG